MPNFTMYYTKIRVAYNTEKLILVETNNSSILIKIKLPTLLCVCVIKYISFKPPRGTKLPAFVSYLHSMKMAPTVLMQSTKKHLYSELCSEYIVEHNKSFGSFNYLISFIKPKL